MPSFLRKIPFAEDLLPAVQTFVCGNQPWELPLAVWIKAGPDVETGALFEMRKRRGKLQVWLHVNDKNELVAYSSLGESNWRWPTPRDLRIPLSIIPNVAIQKQFQGQPADLPRYSSQILEHLIFEARQHTNRQPLLGLYVDPRNAAAIKVYQRTGFVDFRDRTDPDDGITYKGMILKLQPLPPQQ
jgi:GNAT superfamily N-acetyltransferase